jgi:hypothetical protein
MLALLPNRRGEPIKQFPDRIFISLEDAEWAVFKIRWETITGTKIPEELGNRP